MTAPEVVVLPTKAALADAIAARLIARIVEIQGERPYASVCLTGGTTGIGALAAVAASPARDAIDWARLQLWWGDERYVAADDVDRNDTGARQALLDHVPVRPELVHPMPAIGTYATVEDAAAAYADELADAAPDGADAPGFDICLLGVGEDGHVASLFPESPGVHDDRTAFAVHGSPKPPPTRISLGMRVIQASHEVWLLAGGEGKAQPIRLALTAEAGPLQIPASAARGRDRTLVMLDEAAASLLPRNLRVTSQP